MLSRLVLLLCVVAPLHALAAPVEFGPAEVILYGHASTAYSVAGDSITVEAHSSMTPEEAELPDPFNRGSFSQFHVEFVVFEDAFVTLSGESIFDRALSYANVRIYAESVDPGAHNWRTNGTEGFETDPYEDGPFALTTVLRPGRYSIFSTAQTHFVDPGASLVYTFDARPIPEPSSLLFALAGAAVLVPTIRRAIRTPRPRPR